MMLLLLRQWLLLQTDLEKFYLLRILLLATKYQDRAKYCKAFSLSRGFLLAFIYFNTSYCAVDKVRKSI